MNIIYSYVMIRDPELPQEEALQFEKSNIAMPTREGQEIRYSWDAPVSLDHEKDRNWYMGMGVTVLVLIIYAIFTGSFLMALTVLVFAGVYMMVHSKSNFPQNMRVVLTERGLLYGGNFYEYTEIANFSFIYGNTFLILDLGLKKRFAPDVSIYLTGAEDIELIRRILGENSEEMTGRHESLQHRFFRLLKL